MNLKNFLVTNLQGISRVYHYHTQQLYVSHILYAFFWFFNEVCVGKKDEQEANAMRRQNV